MDLKAHLHDKRKAESAKKKAQRDSKPKEMRYSAKIATHDLDVKTQKVISFLEKGKHVRVSVGYVRGLAQAFQERPRRAVMYRVVSAVAESGCGHCDAASIRADNASLHAMMMAVGKSQKTPPPSDAALEVLCKPSKRTGASQAGPRDIGVREGDDDAAADLARLAQAKKARRRRHSPAADVDGTVTESSDSDRETVEDKIGLSGMR
jgi:hypothetical protein